MLMTSPIINSLCCNLSTDSNAIVRSCRYSSFSIQSYSNPPDHRLHSLSLCRSYPCISLLSLFEGRFESDPVLEEEEEEKSSLHLASLVKVTCRKRPSNYLCPPRKPTKVTTGSGFIVSGRKVLTCAHCVDHHTKVQLKKHDSDTLYIATVLAVALECDLALLTVDDDAFWEGVMPVTFGGMPTPEDKLTIMGYPKGKFSMATTSVKRVSMFKVSLSHFEHLCVKVEIAIERGYSGGPVFNKRGQCVGMVFQRREKKGTDIIAVPVIGHFLQDYDKNGAYTGFPTLGIIWQNMENPDLRLFMKMGHGQQGVLIREVKPNYPESEILKPNDIILSIDGINIDNDGTVPFTQGQRIPFSYLLTQKYVGDRFDLKVLRDSEIQKYNIKLATHKQFKPANINGRPCPYYIIAGFVFTTLSFDYLRSEYGYHLENIPNELIWQALYEERVVISKVLNGGTIDGYRSMDSIENAQVLAVNGMPVHGLKTFRRIVESCNEEFLEFILDKQKKLVLHTTSAKARTPYFLTMHKIRSARGRVRIQSRG